MYPSTFLKNFIFFLPFLAFAYLDQINPQKLPIAIIDHFNELSFFARLLTLVQSKFVLGK
jgi:hypothetical protein